MTLGIFQILLIIFGASMVTILVIMRLAAVRIIRTHHGQKCDFFAAHPIQPDDIVFLGDSLTDGARWDEIFPHLPVKNRGINADTTLGVLARLDTILPGKPAAIFLLIGTNDLPWYIFRSNEMILQTYREIIARIQTESPNTHIHVQSLLPRGRRYAVRIQALNRELESLAAQTGCLFIDIHPALAGPHGELRPEFTNDNLHLMAAGYTVWKKALLPYLDALT